jgi:nitrate reductase alpha subunit
MAAQMAFMLHAGVHAAHYTLEERSANIHTQQYWYTALGRQAHILMHAWMLQGAI